MPDIFLEIDAAAPHKFFNQKPVGFETIHELLAGAGLNAQVAALVPAPGNRLFVVVRVKKVLPMKPAITHARKKP